MRTYAIDNKFRYGNVMKPFLFGVIPAYGFFIFVGAALGVLLATFRRRHDGITNKEVFFTGVISLTIGLIGAKLFYIFGTLPKVIAGDMPWIALFESGFMFYGGLIFGILGALLCAYIFNIPIKRLFDALSFGVPVGQAFGRIGCFCAGCCFGIPTDSAIGVVFTHPLASTTPVGVPLVPTQLIESASCFLIAVIMLVVFSKKRKDGAAFWTYIVLYAVTRFIIEFFRGDAERGMIGALSSSQFVAVLFLSAFVVYLIVRKIVKAKIGKNDSFLEAKGVIYKLPKCAKWNIMKFDQYANLK